MTVTDANDCTVVTSVSVEVDPEFCDCAGILDGTALIDECGVCLEQTDPNFNQSCVDCAGIPNGGSIFDDCGDCLEPTDPNFNQSCADCAGILNGTAVLDDCGVCLERGDLDFNQSCLDCAGVPNGTAVIDACGVCLQPDDREFNRSCADQNVVYIPNAFSPNGDGLNDRFQVFGATEVVAQVKRILVFNRWGQRVYQQEQFNFEDSSMWWDGTTRGREVPAGVFVYFIEIEFITGDIKQYKGDLTMIR